MEFLPIVSIEKVQLGEHSVSITRLTNLAWVIAFRIECPSLEALTSEKLKKIIVDLQSVLSDPVMESVFLSFSVIKNPLAKTEEAFGLAQPSGLATVARFEESHRDTPYVSARRNLLLRSAFTWDIFGAVAIWDKNEKRAVNRLAKIVSSLTAGPLNFIPLSSSETLGAIFQHFSPWRKPPKPKGFLSFDRYLFVSEAVVNPEDRETILYDDHWLASLRLENVIGIETEEGGNPIPADSSLDILFRIPFPFRYFVNVYVPNQARERRRLDAMRGFAKGVAYLGLSAREYNLEKAKTLTEMLTETAKSGQSLVRVSCGLVFAGSTREEVSEMVTIASRISASEGITLARENISALETVFIRSVPMLAASKPEIETTTTARGASIFLPYGQPFKGKTPDFPVLSRMKTPVALSLSEASAAKWGAIVIAPSGSGKTFFMNCFFLHILSLREPPFVVIIDMASRPSYLGLVNAFRGLHLDMSLSETTSAVNPLEFKFPLDRPPERHIAFLVERFFPALLGKDLTPGEKAALELALEKTYKVYLDESDPGFSPNRVEDSDLYDDPDFARFEDFLSARKHFLAQDNLELAELAHRQAMPTLADLAQTLGSDPGIRQTVGDRPVDELLAALTAYTAGPYSKFFSSPTGGSARINFNSPLVYVELSKILNYPSLLPAIFLLLRNYLIEKTTPFPEDEFAFSRTQSLRELAFHLKTRPKIFAYDEWHNLKGSKLALSAVDYDFRQGRTMRRIPVLISQSARDVDEEAILVNTALKILLSHLPPENPDETALQHSREVFKLDEKLFDLLAGLRLVKGEYSEALVISEGSGAGVVRLYPTPQEVWTVTSDAVSLGVRERVVKTLMEKGFPYETAFEKAVAALAEVAPDEKFSDANALVKTVLSRILGED